MLSVPPVSVGFFLVHLLPQSRGVAYLLQLGLCEMNGSIGPVTISKDMLGAPTVGRSIVLFSLPVGCLRLLTVVDFSATFTVH